MSNNAAVRKTFSVRLTRFRARSKLLENAIRHRQLHDCIAQVCEILFVVMQFVVCLNDRIEVNSLRPLWASVSSLKGLQLFNHRSHCMQKIIESLWCTRVIAERLRDADDFESSAYVIVFLLSCSTSFHVSSTLINFLIRMTCVRLEGWTFLLWLQIMFASVRWLPMLLVHVSELRGA